MLAAPPRPMDAPHFSSALSIAVDSSRAREEAVEELRAGLEGRRPDLVCAFVSHHHGPAIERLGGEVLDGLGGGALIGCTGESIIGGSREVEQQPAISLWAASLPGTQVRTFATEATAGLGGEPLYSSTPEVSDPARASLLLLGDPFSFPMDHFLQRLNDELPGVPAAGGMASGGMGPGQNLMLHGRDVHAGGAVGAVLEGGIEIRSVVSQGCRPVGKPWVVTACHEHMIQKLAGRPALEVLHEALEAMDPADREVFRRAPFVGLAIDAAKSQFERGDFLVRGLLGLQPQEGAFAVADQVRRGMTVQFLVRDADSASEDLAHLMESHGGGALEALPSPRSAGALLFSCNGRGTRMFDAPDHDIGRVRAGLQADVPVAGFFAAGEIGPVGGRNFLHGFTASVFVFRPRGPA